MSVLVIQLAPRPRLRARGDSTALPEGVRTTEEYGYALSPDGLVLQSQGQCASSLLPRADSVVAVVSDADVSWHRIALPKAPQSRLRAALAGMLEEAVLEEPELMHFAVAPEAVAGQPTWVAAIDRAWLKAELAALEKANVFVDRVVPAAWPDDPPSGHFAEAHVLDESGEEDLSLTWSHPDGLVCMRLHGGLARSLVPLPAPPGTRWSASPGAAAAAEQWLGSTVNSCRSAITTWSRASFSCPRASRTPRCSRRSCARRSSAPNPRAASTCSSIRPRKDTTRCRRR